MLAAPARAQAPAGGFELAQSPLPGIGAWMGEPGYPGFHDQAWFDTGFQLAYAGLAAGGWGMVLPGRPDVAAPYPGVLGVGPMLAGFDSLRFVAGEGGATQAFEGTLGNVIAVPERPLEHRTRAVVRLGSGDYGDDENALAIERGDSLRWLRTEVSSGTHGKA